MSPAIPAAPMMPSSTLPRSTATVPLAEKVSMPSAENTPESEGT